MFISVLTRSALGAPPLNEEAQAALTLRIVPRVPSGGTIYAIVGIKNSSKKPVWLNGRLIAGPSLESMPMNTRNVWFDVTFDDSQPVIDRCPSPYRPAPFTPNDYRILEPGQSVDADIDLSCYDLTKLGHYVIVAHYLDQRDKPKPPKNAYPVNDQLISPRVSFDVLVATTRTK